jgi:hypothetical protein
MVMGIARNYRRVVVSISYTLKVSINCYEGFFVDNEAYLLVASATMEY